jgi:hypothetical protein
MKTKIDIDERLMRRAMRLSGLKRPEDVVVRAIELLVRLKQQERIRQYRGKLPIFAAEGAARAKRILSRNRKLFRRLASK